MESRDVRDWLQRVVKATGLRPSALARKAGIAPSTLLRGLDAKNPVTPSTRTLIRISTAAGVMLPDLSLPFAATKQKSQATSEVTLYDQASSGPLRYFDLKAKREKQFLVSVQTRAVDLRGILPGTVVLVDPEVSPSSGDVVVADILSAFGAGIPGGILGAALLTQLLESCPAPDREVPDTQRRSKAGAMRGLLKYAEVPQSESRWSPVIRLYDPPYLLVHTLDSDISSKPMLVDSHVTRICGVVVAAMQIRR